MDQGGEGKVHRITHSECECRAFFHARKRHACFLLRDTKETKGCMLENVYRIKSSEHPPFQRQSCPSGEPSHRQSLHLSRGHSYSLAQFPTVHSSCCLLPASVCLWLDGLIGFPHHLHSVAHSPMSVKPWRKRSGPLPRAQCSGEAEAALSDKICSQDSSGCFSMCW